MVIGRPDKLQPARHSFVAGKVRSRDVLPTTSQKEEGGDTDHTEIPHLRHPHSAIGYHQLFSAKEEKSQRDARSGLRIEEDPSRTSEMPGGPALSARMRACSISSSRLIGLTP